MSAVNSATLPRPIRLASALVAAAAALAALDAVEAVAGLRHVDAGTGTLLRVIDDPGQARYIINSLHGSLHNNFTVGVGLVLLLLPLAYAVRRPSRRIRTTVWVLAVVAWAALGCGLATGPEILSTPTGVEEPAVQHAWSDLLPGWYSGVHAVTVFLILAALTAAALLLTRADLATFYSRNDPPAGSTDVWSHLRRDDTRSA